MLHGGAQGVWCGSGWENLSFGRTAHARQGLEPRDAQFARAIGWMGDVEQQVSQLPLFFGPAGIARGALHCRKEAIHVAWLLSPETWAQRRPGRDNPFWDRTLSLSQCRAVGFGLLFPTVVARNYDGMMTGLQRYDAAWGRPGRTDEHSPGWVVLGAVKRPDGQLSANKQGDELDETDPWGCDGGSVQIGQPAPPARPDSGRGVWSAPGYRALYPGATVVVTSPTCKGSGRGDPGVSQARCRDLGSKQLLIENKP